MWFFACGGRGFLPAMWRPGRCYGSAAGTGVGCGSAAVGRSGCRSGQGPSGERGRPALLPARLDNRHHLPAHRQAPLRVVVFGALNILRAVLVFGIFGPRSFGLFSIWSLISMLLSLITFAAWLILMIYAYQGKRVEVPIAAGIAKSIAGRMPVARSTPL
jgi:uncharacterized membrane protein